jgi:hypothetical protein
VSQQLSIDVITTDGVERDRSTEPRRGWVRRVDRTVWMLIALAIGSGVAAVIVSREVFPLYSINHDDSVYVYGARILRSGRFDLPFEDYEFLRPWAVEVVGDSFVSQYPPVWPAVLLISEVVTGSLRPALGLIAAGLVLAMYALTLEVTNRRNVALVASAFVALSPVTILLNGTYLAYSFQLFIQLVFAWLLLSGVRAHARWRLAGAGVALGLAFFARPYDAVLFALPFGIFLLWQHRRSLPALLRAVGTIAIGLIPVLLLDGLYNQRVLGSPLRVPISLLEGSEPGFGNRPVSTIAFGPDEGWDATAANLGAVRDWAFGGAVLFVLAVIGVVVGRRWLRPGAWAVLGVALTFTVGYAIFWSPYAMSHDWPGLDHLGFYYHLPVIVPLGLFAAVGLVALWHRTHLGTVIGAVALVAVTWSPLETAIDRNLVFTRDAQGWLREYEAENVDRGIVFMPGRGDASYSDAFPFLEQRPDRDEAVLFADDQGLHNLALMARHPDLPAYQLNLEIDVFEWKVHVDVVPIEVRSGSSFTFDVTVTSHDDYSRVTSYVLDEVDKQEIVLDEDVTDGGTSYQVQWQIGSSQADAPNAFWLRGASGTLAIGAQFDDGPGTPNLSVEYDILYEVHDDGTVVLVLPGRRVALAPGSTDPIGTDVSSLLTYQVR